MLAQKEFVVDLSTLATAFTILTLTLPKNTRRRLHPIGKLLFIAHLLCDFVCLDKFWNLFQSTKDDYASQEVDPFLNIWFCTSWYAVRIIYFVMISPFYGLFIGIGVYMLFSINVRMIYGHKVWTNMYSYTQWVPHIPQAHHVEGLYADYIKYWNPFVRGARRVVCMRCQSEIVRMHVELPCGHVFHDRCLNRALPMNQRVQAIDQEPEEPPRCPVC